MAGLLKISTKDSRELRATVQALKAMPRDLQGNIRKYTQSELVPEWSKSLAEHAETRLEHRMLVDTARVSVSNQNVMLKSATVGRSLSGGISPKVSAAAVEFGADRSEKVTYTARSRKGKAFSVTRRTRSQLRPRRRNGYVVWQAAADFIPRAASLWIQTTVRSFYEAVEGR